MINGRMWLVVKPTVFIPVCFVAIVVASLSVHTALLLTTDFFPAFLKGGRRAAVSEIMPTQPAVPAALASVQISQA